MNIRLLTIRPLLSHNTSPHPPTCCFDPTQLVLSGFLRWADLTYTDFLKAHWAGERVFVRCHAIPSPLPWNVSEYLRGWVGEELKILAVDAAQDVMLAKGTQIAEMQIALACPAAWVCGRW